MRGFVFLCANSTEKECLKHLLFGGKKEYQTQVKNLQPGDMVYLYNYQSNTLNGEYVAVTEGRMNIEPERWEGRFPWQVKVAENVQYLPLNRADFEHLVIFRNGKPTASLNAQQVEGLRSLFRSPTRVTPSERDYRGENLAEIGADDGHKVRSQAERMIDNWLSKNRIRHAYETRVMGEARYCDFYIPDRDVYIEYWGMEDEKYMERKHEKLVMYKKYDLNLIELMPGDLKNLDTIMREKLKY